MRPASTGRPRLSARSKSNPASSSSDRLKPCCRQNTIYPRRIDGPGRTMALPRPARQLIKLFPIPFVPSRHFTLATNARCVSLPQMLLRFLQPFGCCSRVLGSPLLIRVFHDLCKTTRATDIRHNSFIARMFLPALFQTRHHRFCFGACQPAEKPVVTPGKHWNVSRL